MQFKKEDSLDLRLLCWNVKQQVTGLRPAAWVCGQNTFPAHPAAALVEMGTRFFREGKSFRRRGLGSAFYLHLLLRLLWPLSYGTLYLYLIYNLIGHRPKKKTQNLQCIIFWFTLYKVNHYEITLKYFSYQYALEFKH